MKEYNKILWETLSEEFSASDNPEIVRSFETFTKKARMQDARGTLVKVAAALFVPVAVLSVWLAVNSGKTPQWHEVSTTYGQTAQFVLPDNTRITLNGGSTLVYPESFSKRNRQVYFTGEGYFEVQADESRPFDVLTNGACVTVHGTKFNLKSYSEDKVIDVSLDEGKIIFSGDENAADYNMVPGEDITFNKETGTVRKNYSESDSGLWRKGEYYFKNETLGNIARDIERNFGVRVVIEREELLNTHYHIALVNGETADGLVRILSMDRSLSVVRTGNTIIIK